MPKEKLTDEQKEKLRLKINQCIVNIMKQHRITLYGRIKISLTGEAREKDDKMLQLISSEVHKLVRIIECQR